MNLHARHRARIPIEVWSSACSCHRGHAQDHVNCIGFDPLRTRPGEIPLVVDLDQAISRRYEAIDRIVSPIGQNDVCDTAFPLLECAVALAKDVTQSPPTKLRGQMMQRLRGRSRNMIVS